MKDEQRARVLEGVDHLYGCPREVEEDSALDKASFISIRVARRRTRDLRVGNE
jgi:hypothetical protein